MISKLIDEELLLASWMRKSLNSQLGLKMEVRVQPSRAGTGSSREYGGRVRTGPRVPGRETGSSVVQYLCVSPSTLEVVQVSGRATLPAALIWRL